MFVVTRLSGGALVAALSILATDAALAQKRPDAAYNAKDIGLEVSAGSQLRRGERLLDPLVATIWTKMTFKGAGPCSADACPLNFNGETVYARRSRVTLVGVADTGGSSGSGSTGSTGTTQTDPAKLQRGDQGERVRKLQEALNKGGATLVVDGNYGRGTVAAVEDYQRKNKLKVDGIAGRETLKLIGV
jgi:Putative peptidoglycan binding domain